MAAPTPAEQTAYAHMQARMIALMLQHDQDGFRRFIDARAYAAETEASPTQPYRDLGVLFFLGRALFEDILPRIVRRLSFESPRRMVVEEPPARGRVQWERTLDASWAERPGEPPLLLHTRQRRRDFATAENLLTVVTLLEYEAGLHAVLHGDRTLIGAQALRHPLNDLAERCSRELVFPQFAGLLPHARRMLDGAEGGVAALEARVAAHDAPGGNRAYQELLAWRVRWRTLHLLRRAPDEPTHDVLGADPQRDNYLYQLWIFYELAELLHHDGKLLAIDTRPGRMALRFTWGSGQAQRSYQLRHDQAIPKHWVRAPGVRPDFYIQRTDRLELREDPSKPMIWHEQGYVLDAKYYKPRDAAYAPSNPVKRMIADLHLTGERHGALLFAFQGHTSNDAAHVAAYDLEPDVEQPQQSIEPLYQVVPERTGAFAIQSNMQIDIWRVLPESIQGDQSAHSVITAVLDRVHSALMQRVDVECYGVLPDVDTINPSGTHPQRCANCQELLAYCPKPHVSRDRIDRVCPRCDCLRNVRLCHIAGRALTIAPPFVKRVLTRDELLASVANMRAWLQEHIAPEDSSEQAEVAREQLLRTVGELTDTYIKMTRADTRQTEQSLREWVFGPYWNDAGHPRGLPEVVRNMLISGEYVWNDFQQSTIEDWAACAVQYTRALEYEIHRRLYEPCGAHLVTKDGAPMQPKQFTIGSVMFMYRERTKDTNWQTLLALVAQPSAIDEASLKQLVIDIEAIREDRNKVAHTQKVDAALANKIRGAVLGQHGQRGLLYRLSSLLNPPAP